MRKKSKTTKRKKPKTLRKCYKIIIRKEITDKNKVEIVIDILYLIAKIIEILTIFSQLIS